MNTQELLSAIHSEPLLRQSCIGVYAADRVPLHLSKGQSCIINTDDQTQLGMHWVLVYQKEPDEIEFFCSYGKAPHYYHQHWKDLFLKRNKRILFNIRQIQNIFSNTCGLHCLFCLYFRCLGLPFASILNNLYKENSCFNDAFVAFYVNKVVKYDLILYLSEPVQVCKPMSVALES